MAAVETEEGAVPTVGEALGVPVCEYVK